MSGLRALESELRVSERHTGGEDILPRASTGHDGWWAGVSQAAAGGESPIL